ncbi:MAG: ACT domain-containing protein [Acidobacteria bacterium]|nr:ACT domain-containing protein [Acidobacteriota bacterium]MCG2816780.1 ACT domain-containing protein [Candidatus Aminicenantes bacterium]MBU1337437.1 ACT domain-containing protein [Acidobacteriota bacterium]MBU1473339.1 ACT domain-containing protein [Acidobacteriota bacterium]MBU2437701.1 ACT domain-containing protein [Acidobacteriota bacterium]
MPNVKLDTELYVTTPNEPGILGRVLGTLANAGVNLRAIRAYSERNHGVFMLLTSDNDKAGKALAALGFKIKTEEVLVVQIDDRIGAGAEIGALLGTAVVDVDYCYGSSAGTGKAILVIKTNDNQKALDTLR